MQNHFRIGGGLHHRAVAHQLAPQCQAVGEIAIMADSEAARVQFREQRLNVTQNGLAGRRITHMADRRIAGQPIDHVAPGEGIADQSKPAFRMKPFAVECDDPSRLLTTMLQGMEAERGNRRRVGVAEYAEYAALLAKPIGVGIEGGRHGHDLGTSTRSSPLRRWSGGAGGLSLSSGLARFSLFKMVLSGSSGNIDISHCPVPARTTLDLAPLTHCGWLRSGTSQMKN